MKNIKDTPLVTLFAGFMALVASSASAFAHEAWFLGTDEMTAISESVPPVQFLTSLDFSMIMIPVSLIALVALSLEPRWLRVEERLFAGLKFDIQEFSSTVLCFGLAIMMIIAAFGLLPMMGQEPGASTLFVANTVLDPSKIYTPVLLAMQLVLSTMLVLGFQVRLAAIGVICLSMVGHVLFGASFFDFSPHFIAPALLILAFGRNYTLFGNPVSNCLLTDVSKTAFKPEVIYPAARIITGIGFVYLAFRYKFLEPGLIATILEHTPLLFMKELSGPIVLIMGLVEFVAGVLLILGVLVRPIAIFLIFAFSFFAFILGESVFYHAQLYAICIVFLAGGANGQIALDAKSATGGMKNVPTISSESSVSRTLGNRNAMVGLFGFIMFVVWYSIPQIHQTKLQNMDVYNLTYDSPAPSLVLEAKTDAAGNWFVTLDAENFLFENEVADTGSSPWAGHAHIYVDTKKVATARDSKLWLGKLEPGRHIITADLRTSDHKLIVTPYGSVTKRVEVHVPKRNSPTSLFGISTAQAADKNDGICKGEKGMLKERGLETEQFVLRGSLSTGY